MAVGESVSTGKGATGRGVGLGAFLGVTFGLGGLGLGLGGSGGGGSGGGGTGEGGAGGGGVGGGSSRIGTAGVISSAAMICTCLTGGGWCSSARCTASKAEPCATTTTPATSKSRPKRIGDALGLDSIMMGKPPPQIWNKAAATRMSQGSAHILAALSAEGLRRKNRKGLNGNAKLYCSRRTASQTLTHSRKTQTGQAPQRLKTHSKEPNTKARLPVSAMRVDVMVKLLQ